MEHAPGTGFPSSIVTGSGMKIERYKLSERDGNARSVKPRPLFLASLHPAKSGTDIVALHRIFW